MSKVLLRYELLGLARDTRTIVLSVLLPIILLPVLLFTLHRFGQQQLGGSTEGFLYSRSSDSSDLVKITTHVFEKSNFREKLVNDGAKGLAEGAVDVVFGVSQPERAAPQLARSISQAFPELRDLISSGNPGRPVIEILYRSDRDRSVRAFLAARDHLMDYRGDVLEIYFAKEKAQVGVSLQLRDISSGQEKEARRYGPALSAFMILILLGGGSVAALDSLAGERERGTLTTLFLSSLPRPSILMTKFFAVALISVLVALIQISNLSFYVMIGWMKLPLHLGWSQGLAIVGALTFLFLGEALFTASMLLFISARSGSFKEAQLFFFPAFLLSFALSLSGLMPDLPSRSVVSLIPLAGPGLSIPEILAGRLDLPVLLLQVFVHGVWAWLLLMSTIRYVEREEFLAGQAEAVGAELQFEQFSGRALPYYAFLAAALMVVPSNFAGLSSLQGQAVFNQLILFGLGPMLLLRLFGQSAKKAIPVRPVSLPILLACLALVPLGQLAATGLSHLLGSLLPAPVKAMEEMMAFMNLESTPPWQVYLMIGILPGIFEEIAFRGVLLHALHRRFPPWTLAAVVALVFGLFHLNFFRVLPTAYLGFFLGLLTLGTGSLVPAMLVHIGNNSLAVFAMYQNVDLEGLAPWLYGLSFLGQVALTALVLRWGRGYPGTRWRKPSLSEPPVAD